jgi:hypothetical protein
MPLPLPGSPIPKLPSATRSTSLMSWNVLAIEAADAVNTLTISVSECVDDAEIERRLKLGAADAGADAGVCAMSVAASAASASP